MGCVSVREDAVDWYLRSRGNLLKSILDGLDFDESIANFAFAKLNLNRHGYDIEKTVEDLVCDSLIQKEMSDGLKRKIDALVEEARGSDMERKLEILDEISRLEQSAKTMEHVAVGDMEDKRTDFVRGGEQKLAPHDWTGRFTERELKHVASSYPDAPLDNDRHYPDAHFFHAKHHPLRRKHAVTNRSMMTELLRSFYLPATPGGQSASELHKIHESDLEKIHTKNENPAIIGHKKYDTEARKDVMHQPFLGPLADHYLHDIYIDSFEDWKDANSEKVKEIMDKFSKPVDQDFALKQLHFEDMADTWESNDFHDIPIDPKSEMSEADIQAHVYGGGNDADLEEFFVPQGLGHMGYMMGLEFFTPNQRHKIMEHIHEKGSDNYDVQNINLGNKKSLSTGRLKRNIAQRMTPEFLSYMRPQHLHGANVKAHIEKTEDHPDGEEFFLKHALMGALESVSHGDGSLVDHILSEYNDILFDPDFLEYDEQGNLPNVLSSLPIKALSQAKRITGRAKGDDDSNYRQNLVDELLELDEDPATYMTKEQLYNLVGYNSDGTPMEEDSHPLLPEFDGPLITTEKLDEVLERAKEHGNLSIKQKEIRNFLACHNLGINGTDLNQLPVDERDAWAIGENGHPIGLSSHFATPYHYQGGVGRSVISYLEKLHDSLPKNEEGFSILGKVHDGQLIPNPKTVGMFGSFMPTLYDKRYGTHSGAHGISSFWDGSSHLSTRNKIRNPKNTPFRYMTSLSGGYSNKYRYLTKKERGEMLHGSSMKPMLHDKGHFTTNPLMSVGGLHNPLVQGQRNARISHRLLTSLGRLYPPHSPAPFALLKRNHIMSGRYPLSHSGEMTNLFGAFHDFAGQESSLSSRGSQSRTRRDKEKGRRLAQIKESKRAEDKIRLNEDAQTNMDDLSDEYDELSDEILNYDEGTEEFTKLNLRLYEIENAMKSIEEDSRVTRGASRGYTPHHDNLEEKDEADMVAIVNMAKNMKEMIERKDPSAFDPTNPEKFLANSARLMRDANIALLKLPSSQHGLTTFNYGEDETQKASVSQMLSSRGEKTVPHHTLAQTLAVGGKEIRPDMSNAKILQQLGLPNDDIHLDLVDRLRENLDGPIKALTHGSLLASGVQFHPRIDYSRFSGIEDHHASLNEFQVNHGYNDVHHSERGGTPRKIAEKGFGADINREYLSKLSFLERLMQGPYAEEGKKYGLSHIPTSNPTKDYGKKANAFGKLTGNVTGPVNEAKSKLHDIFLFDPNKAKSMEASIAPAQSVTEASFQLGREITPAHTQGTSVQDMYISGTMDGGYEMTPTIGFEFTGSKHPETGINAMLGTNMESQMLHSVQQPVLEALHGNEAVEQVLSSGYQVQNPTPNILRPDITGLPPNTDPMNISKNASEVLVALMNPDALLKKDTAKPPPILPMHRIFSLKDFDSLRGFSGDWVVSAFYEGDRLFITRKKHSITAYDRNGEAVPLDEDDKKHLKALTDRNYVIDVVKQKDEIHVIDIVNYDDTNIADLTIRERLKVLRGQFDSHEHVLVPGPHNTRVTEEGGLEDTVSSLQEEHNQLLLRDAKSTYMLGESRHPKWFLLRSNKEISLIILDVRGKGPYTYRLGAGPLDAEGLGNRGVSYDGKEYLDVGTVKSPKPFNEGDIVKVSVSGVKSRTKNNKTIYDVTPVKIKGEGDSEGAVSLETLSLLAKSHPLIAVSFDLELQNDRFRVGFEGIDDVIYKLDSGNSGIWAHSPISVMGELSHSDYPVILAESVRPLWSQALSLMQKGVDIEGKGSGDIETDHSMNNAKDRKRTEKESAGIIDADDENNILKPHMVKMMSRIADLVERVDNLHKEKMTGGPGARGLGIDVGSQIESPRGPTHLTSEESLPDWDMRERPTEDSEEEYAHVRNKRIKRKNREQSNDYRDFDYED